jgi:hypothetical protein
VSVDGAAAWNKIDFPGMAEGYVIHGAAADYFGHTQAETRQALEEGLAETELERAYTAAFRQQGMVARCRIIV